MSAPTTPLLDGYDLLDYRLTSHPVSDATPNLMAGEGLSVLAVKFTSNPSGRVIIRVGGGSFDYSTQITTESARIIAAALFAAAIAVDDFEADECAAQEREMARYNAGPVEIRNLPGGVTELIAIDETTDLRGWVTAFEGVEVRA